MPLSALRTGTIRRQWICCEYWRVEEKLAPCEGNVEVLRRVYNKIFNWVLSAGPG